MMNKNQIEILNYDLEKYNFPKIIKDLIRLGDLEDLKPDFDLETPENESSLYKNMERTKAYSQMYTALGSHKGQEFYETFDRFILEVVRPQYNTPIYYQKKPTHRILYANAPGVSRFHRDRDYGHNPKEINFFIPQTRAYDTNTLWIESGEGKSDFKAINLEPGQFLRFDGANLEHGAKVNDTGKTRVSFDFRIIPAAYASKEHKTLDDGGEQNLQKSLKNNPHTFQLLT